MKPEAFAALARWLKERTGFVLQPDKLYLVEARLAPVVRQHGMGDLDKLAAAIQNDKGALAAAVVDALTIGDTSFFRDLRPFEQLCTELLPRICAARGEQKRLRFWSAGCSTGQEAYSLAMMIDEIGDKLKDWKIEIVGTDINRTALEKARGGVYGRFEVQRGLPVRALLQHFTQEGSGWRISEKIRRRVEFRAWNLLDDPAPLGQFDVIFCRNVLLFFDLFMRGAVLGRLAKSLAPDGALYLGVAETVLGVTDRFAPIAGQRAAYGLAAAAAEPVARAS